MSVSGNSFRHNFEAWEWHVQATWQEIMSPEVRNVILVVFMVALSALFGRWLWIILPQAVSACTEGRYCNAIRYLKFLPPDSPYALARSGDAVDTQDPFSTPTRVRWEERWLGEALVTCGLPWASFLIAAIIPAVVKGSVGERLAFLVNVVAAFLHISRIKIWECHDLKTAREPMDEQELRRVDSAAYHEQVHAHHHERCLPCKARTTLCISLNWLFGAGEVIDAVLDGQAIAGTLRLKPEHVRRFKDSWESSVWLLGSVIAWMGPGLACGTALGFASIMQLISTASTGYGGNAGLAGACALQAIEQEDWAYSERRANTECLLFIVRALFENAIQLVMQTSLMAAEGKGPLGSQLLAASILVSWIMLLVSWIGICRALCTRPKRCIWVPFTAPMPMFLAYIALKLYYIELCPSGEWGFSTGCVHFK